jgi:hypothetical protein
MVQKDQLVSLKRDKVRRGLLLLFFVLSCFYLENGFRFFSPQLRSDVRVKVFGDRQPANSFIWRMLLLLLLYKIYSK